MLMVVARRLLYLVPVMFLVTLATFFMLNLVPGDPAAIAAGENATPQQYALVRHELGLDQPAFERYVQWLSQAMRGDLGYSLVPPYQSVSTTVGQRLPVTLELAAMAIVVSLVIAAPVALRAAYRAGDRFDRTANLIAFGGLSIPSFLAALLLVFLAVFNSAAVKWLILLASLAFAVWLARYSVKVAGEYPRGPHRTRALAAGLGGAVAALTAGWALSANLPEFPREGFVRLVSAGDIPENLRHVVLPVLTLAIPEAAILMRVLRGDLISTLQEEFILSAKAKGMPAWRIMVSDALRPSSFSAMTVSGVALGRLIGGTVIVETIFNLPGMGTMIVGAIQVNDYRVVQAGVLVIALVYVVINAFVDVSYAFLDPRIRRA